MPYERVRFSAENIEQLLTQLNEDHDRLWAALLNLEAETISLRPLYDEPRQIAGTIVWCQGGVTWNGQSLSRGLYVWDDIQTRWEKP